MGVLKNPERILRWSALGVAIRSRLLLWSAPRSSPHRARKGDIDLGALWGVLYYRIVFACSHLERAPESTRLIGFLTWVGALRRALFSSVCKLEGSGERSSRSRCCLTGKKARKSFWNRAFFLENLKRNGDSHRSSRLKETDSKRPRDFSRWSRPFSVCL